MSPTWAISSFIWPLRYPKISCRILKGKDGFLHTQWITEYNFWVLCTKSLCCIVQELCEWHTFPVEIVPRSRVSFHLFSDVYLWFVVMIHNPSTTQWDTKTHTFRLVYTRSKTYVLRDGFVDFTTVPVLDTEDEILDILRYHCASEWFTSCFDIEFIKGAIPVLFLFCPERILDVVFHSVINPVFQLFGDYRVVPRC